MIVLDDLDFSWFHNEVDIVLQMWKSGIGLIDMADQLRPGNDDGQYEVLLLLLHMARQGKITPRAGGIWGMCNE